MQRVGVKNSPDYQTNQAVRGNICSAVFRVTATASLVVCHRFDFQLNEQFDQERSVLFEALPHKVGTSL